MPSETAKRIAAKIREQLCGTLAQEMIETFDFENAIDQELALPKPAPPKAECNCGGTGTVYSHGCMRAVFCPCIHAKLDALKAAVEQLRRKCENWWGTPTNPAEWTPLP